MSNDLHLDGDFTLNTPNIEGNFTPNQQPDIQADFNIKITPDKVSQLENDLNYQTKTEVDNAIEEAIEQFTPDIQGSDLIGVTKENQTITITSKTFVFEQAIASDTWEINHNLNKFPVCIVIDSSGLQFQPQINYIDKNNLTASMNGATTGTAYLN